MRVLVTGGRAYRDAEHLDSVLSKFEVSALCHGAAPGADSLAAAWAEEHMVMVTPYPADWEGPCTNQCKPGHRKTRPKTSPRARPKTYCPAAGVYRNQDMLDDFDPELVIAFPGGRGTADMVRRATAALGQDRVVFA